MSKITMTQHRNSLISPCFVEEALKPLLSRGIDPAPLLNSCGIDATLQEPVTIRSYGKLWRRIADVLDDEFFCLGARQMPRGSFELLCHSVITSLTLEEALVRGLKFLSIVLHQPSARLQVAKGQAILQVVQEVTTASAFTYRTFWLIILGVCCWLIAKRIPLLKVEFACEAPRDMPDYSVFFGCQVEYGAKNTAVYFDINLLTLPNIRRPADVPKFLQMAPANLLIRYRHDQTFTDLVRTILEVSSPAEWPRFDRLATTVGTAPSILRRKLKSEGTSYSKIKDSMRMKLSRDILETGDMTISELAFHMGYSEPSAFYRAFKKANGTSPRSRR
ncbi:AraC family transcriptional regulator [Rhizobium rhizoryzae]|uniref:AraC-like DNA-binding protein n=1 Tax=Rhizobium rhizoryzae TaxID=451876 RepID=A0A7W6LHB4_9HYPH|nr:AraC family transcriptional regulator [Rhizobium rhizoryzae]MBB4144394.1 AraC-like DNA-binding protein [Rhizobium rhizoryzae]